LTPDKPLTVPVVPAPAVAPPVTAPAPPLDPATFSDAHRAVVSDSAIQFDLPMHVPEPPSPPPAWLQWLSNFLGTDHPGIRAGLWILAALFVLAIAALIWTKVSGREWPWSRGAKDGEADEGWRPEAGRARTLLGEADALAAAGRYSEAAHLLLYRSIEDVDERRPELIRKSLTSRDIAALPAIPERPRGAFARIAMLVERGIYARGDHAQAEWHACRAAYEEFAFAEAWR
jgi:hypothetical protein